MLTAFSQAVVRAMASLRVRTYQGAAPAGFLPSLPLEPAAPAPAAARLLHRRGGQQAVDGVQPGRPQGVVVGLVPDDEHHRDLRAG